MADTIAQILGYLASLLLALSLIVNNDLKFRWLNTFGCLSFIIYGVIIQAFPIILTNSILLVINVYYLVKLFKAEEDFELFEFKGDEKLIHKFLSFYAKDIQKYFPDYVHDDSNNNLRFVVLRDLVIANIFIAELMQNGTAVVKINYTAERYRDYKVGKFIFNHEKKFLWSKGVKKIHYTNVSNTNHAKFLKVMGFQKTIDGSYHKDLIAST